jgi:hypothetical protein
VHLPVVCAVAFAFPESAKSPPVLAGVRSLRILNAGDALPNLRNQVIKILGGR